MFLVIQIGRECSCVNILSELAGHIKTNGRLHLASGLWFADLDMRKMLL